MGIKETVLERTKAVYRTLLPFKLRLWFALRKSLVDELLRDLPILQNSNMHLRMNLRTKLYFKRINDIGQTIDGWLTKDQAACLYLLAGQVGRQYAIVELGAWKGKATIYLATGAMHGKGAQVYAVDIFAAIAGQADFYAEHTGRQGIKYLGDFLANLNRLDLQKSVNVCQGYTGDVGETWTGQPVGLLFIDADHDETAVWQDWLVWSRHLIPGAYTIFHDYGGPFSGVTRVVDRLAQKGALLPLALCDQMFIGSYSANNVD